MSGLDERTGGCVRVYVRVYVRVRARAHVFYGTHQAMNSSKSSWPSPSASASSKHLALVACRSGNMRANMSERVRGCVGEWVSAWVDMGCCCCRCG